MIDFNISEGAPIQNSDIELITQQIDLLFDTNLNEVLGDENFGSKYEDYLYRLKLSADELKNQVYSDICSLELFGFTPAVDVYLLQGTQQDIALINIVLTRDLEKYNKTYKIS